MKLDEQQQRLQSHQRRMVLIDELQKVSSSGGDDQGGLVQGIARQISGKIMDQVEALIKTCLTKSDFERFT